MCSLNATYTGGNVVRMQPILSPSGHAYVTMTQLRAMMDELEASYREKSCCPSCGTLTLDGSQCVDCERYESTKIEDAPIGDTESYVSLDELLAYVTR